MNKIEVLNISNKDSLGATVLNDAKLIELVELYPFLYNPRVRSYQDPHYEEWAWQRITAAFNRLYDENSDFATVDMLKQRWEVLQSLIKRLADMSIIPEPLRHLMVKISIQLQDQTVADPRLNNSQSLPQSLILENIEMVERLPLKQRRRLEAEMMDLILSTELDAKATIRLGEEDKQRVEQEYERFLKSMQLKEVFVLRENENGEVKMEENGGDKMKMEGDVIPDGSVDGESMCGSSTVEGEETNTPAEEMLLRPMAEGSRWVPLADAEKYIKRCVVRLKRVTVEDDDLPLAMIKRKPRLYVKEES